MEALAKDYGYTLKLYPVEATAPMQDQDLLGSTCGAIDPTGSHLQGWGAMNPTAVQEAAKIGFKMDHLVGVWWSGATRMHVRQAPVRQGLHDARHQRSRDELSQRFRTSSNT